MTISVLLLLTLLRFAICVPDPNIRIGVDIKVDNEGNCGGGSCTKECDQICTTLWDPICGSNGQGFETFSNRGCFDAAVKCDPKYKNYEAVFNGECVCMLQKDSGPCLADFRRYYYDLENGTCRLFDYYGGCGGNANRFKTYEECTDRCGFGESDTRPSNLTIPEVPTLPDPIESQALLNFSAIQNGDYYDLAKHYAPVLRFDMKQGNPDLCFISSASDYYNARKDGNTDQICNRDYSTMENSGTVPSYWKAAECGLNLHIEYWAFYGYQDACGPFGAGSHPADWEHILLKVENYQTAEHSLGPVQFYQHAGWYTRVPGSYEVWGDDQHNVVVYIGKNSHGSYHDAGGWGGCLYWADYRNPEDLNQYVATMANLEELKRGESSPAFMNDEDSQRYFDGIPSPLDRGDKGCEIKGCSGHATFGTNGCLNSQVDDETNF